MCVCELFSPLSVHFPCCPFSFASSQFRPCSSVPHSFFFCCVSLSRSRVRVNQNESGVLSLPCHAIIIIIILDGRMENVVSQSVASAQRTQYVMRRAPPIVYLQCSVRTEQRKSPPKCASVIFDVFILFSSFVVAFKIQNSSDFRGYNYHVSHQYYVMWMSDMCLYSQMVASSSLFFSVRTTRTASNCSN